MEVELQKYIDQKKNMYDIIIDFIENEDCDEEYYENFQKNIITQKVDENREELDHFLRLIISITNNHHRFPGFFHKIEHIYLIFKDKIKQTYSNIEIYKQVKSNKLVLLFFIKNEMITLDEYIVQKIESKGTQFSDFFIPEISKIKPQISDRLFQFSNTLEEYEKNRQIGENDSYVCSLIRQDSIEEFISYVNRTNLSISGQIQPSIFETNPFLITQNPTLIEYAAFFGSVQVFQYLNFNKVNLKSSLWIYAIHSNNSILLRHHIEGNKIIPNDENYEDCLKESIKCHHNDFAKYIELNLIKIKYLESFKHLSFSERLFECVIQNGNYLYLPNDLNISFAFYYLKLYGYSKIVNILIQINNDYFESRIKISKKIFFFE